MSFFYALSIKDCTLKDGKIYIMMNKPCGYVCSSVSDRHKPVYTLLSNDLQELVKNAPRGRRLHTVGRLDCDTSGLLLFTNDGLFSHNLTSPQNEISKTYIAELKDKVCQEFQLKYINEFEKGIVLPPEKKAPLQNAMPAKIEFLSPYECKVTVTEGKFHLIKRMFMAFENEVVSLKRISFGSYTLPEDLHEGSYIEIDAASVQK